MEIKKYFSYIFCTSLLLSTAGQLQAVRADEARENMNLFRRSVQSFQRTWDRYNRCIRGKCSDEERQKVRKELQTTAKKAAKYGLILAAIVGTGILLRRKGIPAVQKYLKDKEAYDAIYAQHRYMKGWLDYLGIDATTEKHETQFVYAILKWREDNPMLEVPKFNEVKRLRGMASEVEKTMKEKGADLKKIKFDNMIIATTMLSGKPDLIPSTDHIYNFTEAFWPGRLKALK